MNFNHPRGLPSRFFITQNHPKIVLLEIERNIDILDELTVSSVDAAKPSNAKLI
jgi:hypothetical protein